MNSNVTGYVARRCVKCSNTVPKGGRCSKGCAQSHLRYQVMTSTTIDGQRKRKSHGTYDKMKEAEAVLAERIEQAKTGMPMRPSELTVETFLREWVNTGLIDRKASTREGYRSIVNARLIPALGTIRLQELSKADVNKMVANLHTEVAARTTRNVVRALQSACEYAMRNELLRSNPAKGVTLPRVVAKPREVWTPEQVTAFLHAAQGHRLEAGFVVLAKTGVRRGELLGMAWRDLDLEAGHWNVEQSLTRGDNGTVVLDSPKTATSRRRLTLDDMTVTALRRRAKQQQEESLALGRVGFNADDLVFTDKVGQPIKPDGFTAAMRRVAGKANLPDSGTHILRHSWATTALELNVHPRVVSEQLGHASVEITLGIYSHVRPQASEEAALKVARLYG